ncbi:putative NADPH dehydrogenase [Rhexocercosporidium sp. MPI-PUGE-AT-0058]|nr:putative NADPH dehydrogenase [Rhexocercosporidium sp. MPI-PUGE-AT-0058]
MPNDILQSPFSLTPFHTLSHRIVLAPMTRMRASSTGIPHPRAAEYYTERTTLGSLLISEGIVVHPRGRGFPNTPGLYTEEQVQAWKQITEAVRKKGGVFFAQLWHVGRVSVPSQTGGFPPLAPTAEHLPGMHPLFGQENGTEPYVDSQAMTEEDIRDVVDQFASAAKNAIRAGFDGVEIHGANGYILDSFVHSNINTRTDKYGGSLTNRLRFPLLVINTIISSIGANKTAIRLAPFHVLQETRDANRLETFTAFATELEKKNLAYVHMVEPRYDQFSLEGAFAAKRETVEVSDVEKDLCKRDEVSLWPLRKVLERTPVVGAGGYDASSARSAVEEGRVDLVAFGRHFTSNPDLVRRLFDGLPLTKYERKTFYTPSMDGYLGWATAADV